MERRDLTGFHSLIGKTVIEIRAHPLLPNLECRSEAEVARQYLASETEESLGWGPEFVCSLTSDKDRRDGAKPLYGIGYSASSSEPRDNPIWGHDLSEIRREIYAYFPRESADSAFYSFDVIVARTSGWTIEWESLRQIDGVIDSFRLEPVPMPPVPPSEVSP